MTTAVDTNILIALWDADPATKSMAINSRDAAFRQAFKGYVERRRKARDPGARRILADFLIGAHAAVNGYRLLTLDDRVYRAAFPKLVVDTA